MKTRFSPGALLVWLVLAAAFAGLLWQAPRWWALQSLEVKQAPLTLGARALAAVGADAEHIRLRRDGQGRWWLANVSRNKKVLLLRDGERRVREWQLQPGAAFSVGTQRLRVESLSSAGLVLKQFLADGQTRSWRYDGLRLWRDGKVLPSCPDDALVQRGLASTLHDASWGWRLARPLRLGGLVHCGLRLGLPHVLPDALRIVHRNGRFLLRLGPHADERLPPVELYDRQGRDLGHLKARETVLQDGDELILGYSRFRWREDSLTARLVVRDRSQRRLHKPAQNHPHWQQHWQRQSLWWPGNAFDGRLWLNYAAVAGVLWLLYLLPPTRPSAKRPSRGRRFFLGLAGFLAGAGALIYLQAGRLPLGWGLAAWLLALLPWALHGWRSVEARRLWLAFMVLLGLGMAVQLQMGLGAAQSHWTAYFMRSAGLVSAVLWLAWLWLWGRGTAPPDGLQMLNRPRVLGGLFLLAMLALGIQALFGSEAGVAGIQPVEFAKWVLLAAAAYALAWLRMQERWRDALGSWRLWRVALTPLLLMAGLMALALAMLHDFSPLVLLLLWALGMGWALPLASPRSVRRRVGLLLMALLWSGLFLGLWWLKGHPDALQGLAQAERIATWADPARFPQSGDQLRQAQQAIMRGGWWGWQWRDGVNAASVMAIPALQDDFAPAFYVNRVGILGAWLLLALQLALLFQLILSALMLRRQTHLWQPGNRFRQQRAWFSWFFLLGAAAFLFAHFVVSWGTNSGLLPVMGQPMPFVSAAGSHLVGFLFPLLITSMIALEALHHET